MDVFRHPVRLLALSQQIHKPGTNHSSSIHHAALAYKTLKKPSGMIEDAWPVFVQPHQANPHPDHKRWSRNEFHVTSLFDANPFTTSDQLRSHHLCFLSRTCSSGQLFCESPCASLTGSKPWRTTCAGTGPGPTEPSPRAGIDSPAAAQ